MRKYIESSDLIVYFGFKIFGNFSWLVTFQFSYLVFLGLFSFFLMTDLKPVENGNNPSTYEYIVWVWAGSMFIEEIRQVGLYFFNKWWTFTWKYGRAYIHLQKLYHFIFFYCKVFTEFNAFQMLTTTPRSVSYKLASYFSSLWNVFDVVVIVFTILSIILRYSLKSSDFNWARRVYAITLVLYYLRFLYIFYVNKNIGPKVIMIRRMVRHFQKYTCSSHLLSFTRIM